MNGLLLTYLIYLVLMLIVLAFVIIDNRRIEQERSSKKETHERQ